MDRDMLLRHLAQSDEHLAESDEHIARQREIIGELEGARHDTTEAHRLLSNMLDARALHQQHRERILRELSE